MRRVHSYVSIDIATGALLERRSISYDGPWEQAKGESKQQMGTNNDVAKQQLAMQQNYLNQYQNYVQQLMKGGGYLPGVKEALNSQAISSVPLGYEQIRRQLATQGLRTGSAGGGALPGGGAAASNFGNLLSQEEQAKAGLLNNITAGGQQNITGAEGGILNAAGITSNVGSSALGSATTAANQANQQSGLLGTIIGGGLGVLGSALGKGGALAGCWVAAELYGFYSPEMLALRKWIFGTWYMRPFAWFYSAVGERWADWIEVRNTPRKFTKLLFDGFLRLANG